MALLTTYFIYIIAAFIEIIGCFSFWIWLRQDKSIFWLIPGILCLVGFALLLTRSDANFAGRAYAAYGGVYIFTSFMWLWIIEGTRPNQWDIVGGCICLIGATIILCGSRTSLV